MQSTFDPSQLSSSPLRQLYDVLSTFERNRDWSKATQEALLRKVAARSSQYQAYEEPYAQLSPSFASTPNSPSAFTTSTVEEIERMLGIPVDDPDLLNRLPNIQATMAGVDPNQLQTLQFWSVPELVPVSTPVSLSAPVQEPSVPEPTGLLLPQYADLMTPREIATFHMLQLFYEISKQRIESWGRIARLVVLQPMDGFATVES